jgi:hypothetical protein
MYLEKKGNFLSLFGFCLSFWVFNIKARELWKWELFLLFFKWRGCEEVAALLTPFFSHSDTLNIDLVAIAQNPILLTFSSV